MTRAIANDVLTLLGNDGTQEPEDVLLQLNMASQFVDTRFVDAGLSAPTLKTLEILLTCHYYTLAHPEVSRESYDGATFDYASYANMYGIGLRATKWGQMALEFDTSGTLAALGLKRMNLEVL